MAGKGFSFEMAEFIEKAKDNANRATKAIILGIAGEIDRRSPVGNPSLWASKPPPGYVGGHFRANWQIGVNVRPFNEIEGVDPDGSRTQGNIALALPNDVLGNEYYLVNNVPYAYRLEMGHSTQAPQGLVGLTIVMYQQIVEEAVSQL